MVILFEFYWNCRKNMIQSLPQRRVKKKVKITEVGLMLIESVRNEENKKKKRRLEKPKGKRSLESLRKNVPRRRKWQNCQDNQKRTNLHISYGWIRIGNKSKRTILVSVWPRWQRRQERYGETYQIKRYVDKAKYLHYDTHYT